MKPWSWLLVAALLALPGVGGCQMKPHSNEELEKAVLGLDGELPQLFKRVSADFFFSGIQAQLALAAEKGDAARVAALIKGGANPNTSDTTFMTPLIWAIYAKNLSGVRALLEGGADAQLPAHIKKKRGAEWHLHPISLATEMQLLEIMRVLLEHGADPETRGLGSAESALMDARYCLPCFKLLVEFGANMDREVDDAKWNTAVISAALACNLDVVLWALESGYNTDLDYLNDFLITYPCHAEKAAIRAQILDILKSRNVQPWKPPPWTPPPPVSGL